MTEAFAKWVKDLQSKTPYHYCGPDDAEHFIRAFVSLVNERAAKLCPGRDVNEKPCSNHFNQGFTETVRELLGE